MTYRAVGRVGNCLGVAAVLALFVASILIRLNDFRSDIGTENLDAAYHSLLTVKAIAARPISESGLLPIVTLSNPLDRWISWGATLPTAKGDFVYTSFPSAGFFVPALLAKLLHIQPSLHYMMAFGCMLGLTSSLLLYSLVFRALRTSAFSESTCSAAGVLAVAVLLFSREGLQSFGFVYWSQSLEQPLLLLQLLVALHVLNSEDELSGKRILVLLGITSFLTAYVEWTGVVTNALFGIYFILRRKEKALFAPAAYFVGIATCIALAATAIHFLSALDLSSTVQTLFARFKVRSVQDPVSASDLLKGYVTSYGTFLVLAFLCLGWLAYNNEIDKKSRAIFFTVLLVSSFPIAENLLFLPHAGKYSFDRLKVVVPLSLIFAYTFAHLLSNKKTGAALILAALIIVAARQNVETMHQENERYAAWSSVNAKNQKFAAWIAGHVDLSCSVIGTDGPVRGYSNVVFNRSIYENVNTETLIRLMQTRGACAAVMLTQETLFHDIPKFTRVAIFKRDGTPVLEETN